MTFVNACGTVAVVLSYCNELYVGVGVRLETIHNDVEEKCCQRLPCMPAVAMGRYRQNIWF